MTTFVTVADKYQFYAQIDKFSVEIIFLKKLPRENFTFFFEICHTAER